MLKKINSIKVIAVIFYLLLVISNAFTQEIEPEILEAGETAEFKGFLVSELSYLKYVAALEQRAELEELIELYKLKLALLEEQSKIYDDLVADLEEIKQYSEKRAELLQEKFTLEEARRIDLESELNFTRGFGVLSASISIGLISGLLVNHFSP